MNKDIEFNGDDLVKSVESFAMSLNKSDNIKPDFEPGDQYDDNNIVCPHCGYQRPAESEDNSEDVFDDECEECGKEFVHWAQISISYVSKKPKD